jgi:beta-fructofuranosidase
VTEDSQRPKYHFLPPENWLNDPNGLIHWQGVYHMFYQHNPFEPVHRDIYWGHATSTNLVHWTHLPVALAPSPDGPDSDGCWSGCAVDDNGVATVIYSGHSQRNPGGFQLPCLATGDADLLVWTKYQANPLMESPPADLDLIAFRDHSVWKEGDTWYQVIGSGIRDAGGTALLFRSHDLRTWEYLHPLASGDKDRMVPLWTGTVWECPDFFHLGDQYVLIISAWDEGTTHHPVYMIGQYRDHRFTAEREGFVDLGSSFYAPQSMFDEQGRRIMFGWLREGRSREAQRAAGWSGAMSLPRVLSVSSGGDLGMVPAPELEMLRGQRYQWSDITVRPASVGVLADIRGAQLEIIAEWEPGDATTLGFNVRCSPDGAEKTVIAYNVAEQQLFVDRTRSSLSDEVKRDVQGGRLILAEGEPLKLHIFLDGSVIEVFANGRACLAERVYPARADSLGIDVFTQGGSATIGRLDVWELQSI